MTNSFSSADTIKKIPTDADSWTDFETMIEHFEWRKY